MKTLFRLDNITEPPAGSVPEDTEVLLIPAYHTKDTNEVKSLRVFVPIGYLTESGAMASKIDAYIRGCIWGTLTRNDGHYIEVEIEEHEGTSDNV